MASTASIQRLSTELGIDQNGIRRLDGMTVRRLVTYYLIVLALTGAFVWWVSPTPTQPPDTTSFHKVTSPPVPVHPFHLFARAAVAICGAFLLSIPVAFTYVRTRNRVNYDRNVVQGVIMLPVVVAAILVVIQNSVALAFSLTGIVAAVRFKNSLEDARDAVYILSGVAIGFAAGVRQLPIAALLSVAFVVLELAIWRLDLTADHDQTFSLLCESRHPTPTAVPVSPDEPHKYLLRIYTTDDDHVQKHLEQLLEGTTEKWKRIDKRHGGVDQRIYDYQVRLPAGDAPGPVIEKIYGEGGAAVIAAEVVTP